MSDALIGGLFLIAAGILTVIADRNLKRANSDSINSETIRKLMTDVQKLSEDMLVVKTSNRALWSYVYELLDFIKDRGLVPPQPPTELDTNPRLKKLFEKEQ